MFHGQLAAEPHAGPESQALKAGQVVVRTKGDANPVEDPWTLEIESKNAPVVITTLPLSAVPILRFDRPLVYGFSSAAVIIFIGLRLRQENRYRRRHVQPT